MNDRGHSEWATAQTSMVEHQLRRRGVTDERVLEVMSRVPRHAFVPPEFASQAYEDHPIPIAEEQTISQPFIVAISLQALALSGQESVLEVGTGSGYQTALLASLARQVYSMERRPALAQVAEATLCRLGFSNVKIAVGDGSQGWPEYAPYHAILVSAAAPALPPSLLAQLAENGRMVIPVGSSEVQQLQLIHKSAGALIVDTLEGCRFVPLIGAEAY